MQPICFKSSDGYRSYGLVLEAVVPTGMLLVQWDAQRERLAGVPQPTKTDWQRYGPRQGESGNYQIAARWSAYSNRASSVQYRYSANGITANCGAPVNQRTNGGTFNVLCTIPSLAAGTTVTVMLRNDDPSGYVIADAVRLQRTSP